MAYANPEPTLPAGPNNLDAEMALLGCVLHDSRAMEACDAVEPQHFAEGANQVIWAEIAAASAAGRVADPRLLRTKLQGEASFIAMGGGAYLGDLISNAPPWFAAKDFAAEVVDLFIRRELVRIADEAKARAIITDTSALAHLEEIEGQLFNIAENRKIDGGFAPFEEAIDKAVKTAAAAFDRDGSLAGLSTGLIDLDKMLGGLCPSDLIILAARPSMGKSALAALIAFWLARAGHPCGFFSLEMSAEQLAMRLTGTVSGVSAERIRKGEGSATEVGRFYEAAAEIKGIPLFIDETGGLSIAKLRSRARRLMRRHGLKLIVVDYLQLLTTPGSGSADNRVQEVSMITQALKALAKELNVPVLALSQLSRQVENREDKRPKLADLRESGSIEQDADVVMFLYRDAYYLGREEPQGNASKHLEWAEKMDQARGIAEIIIGKQRHGPIGTARVAFHDELTQFSNLAREGRFDPAPYNPRLPYGERDD